MEKICKLDIKIDAKAPIVLTNKSNNTVLTTSSDAINGTIIRGALAGLYIRKYQLGSQAHLDKDFQSLFLDAGIRFLPANPVAASQRTDILPMSIMQDKITKTIRDAAYSTNTGPGWKNLNGYGTIVKDKIHMAQIEKNISLHMSRNQENERISGKSEEGHIYNYEAIQAGQSFIGTLIGPQTLLEKMQEKLNLTEGTEIYIGRSKYNQYGYCQLTADKIQKLNLVENINKAVDEQGFVTLYCTTPYIPCWPTGDNRQVLLEIVQNISNRCPAFEFELGETIFAKTEKIINYVGAWNLKRNEEQAISAGSVFKLKCKAHQQWPAEAAQALEQVMSGIGVRRNQEGYGQLRLWQKNTKLIMNEADVDTQRPASSLSEQVIDVVVAILHNRIRKEIRQKAFKALDKSNIKSMAGKNHLFSRLESILENCYQKNPAKCSELFQQNINIEIRPKSKAETNLRKMILHNTSMLDILRGTKANPEWQNFSWEQPFENAILNREIREMANEIEYQLPQIEAGDFYYEYWLWFFRHARKQAAKAVEQ